MRFLATTNRGVETVAIEEIESLVGAAPSLHHPGMVEFEATESAVRTLHTHARSLHRVLIERARNRFESVDDIYDIARTLEVTELLGPDQPFAVRAQRHGEHEFGSPDVERVVGQAIIDGYRDAAGTRPPVDLDDPGVVFRVLVRHDRALIAIDATGKRSMHRRWYRRREHEAALRPTLAYAMLHLAGYDGDQRLADPMCGTGTIPIEAALLGGDRSPTRDHVPAFRRFKFLDTPSTGRNEGDPEGDSPPSAPVVGTDVSNRWIEAARENAAVAGVDEYSTFRQQDATVEGVDADVIVTDLPFGIRTQDVNLPRLYRDVFETLGEDWETLVLLTTRDDLVPYDATERHTLRRGRLEVELLVIE